MWSSRFLAVATILASLGGCGFHPLYGQNTATRDVPADFSSIAIAPIPNRVGQQLRNDLLDLLTPKGRATDPVFRLNVSIAEEITDLAIGSSGLATRANLRLDATYSLVKEDTGQSLMTGKSLAVSSYNLVSADFSNLTAQNDARSRAALRIAREIRARLGAFFARRRNTAAEG